MTSLRNEDCDDVRTKVRMGVYPDNTACYVAAPECYWRSLTPCSQSSWWGCEHCHISLLTFPRLLEAETALDGQGTISAPWVYPGVLVRWGCHSPRFSKVQAPDSFSKGRDVLSEQEGRKQTEKEILLTDTGCISF